MNSQGRTGFILHVLVIFVCTSAFFKEVTSVNSGCECVGPRPCLETPEKTPTGSECLKTPRPDCPCCLVCAHTEDEVCDDLSQPCDLSSGLFCNQTIGTCQKGKTLFECGIGRSQEIDGSGLFMRMTL